MIKVKVEKLQKSFGSLEVLKGIDLEVKEGEVVCLIGPSGSGKSTFLRCLNRLEETTAGTVIVDDNDITDPKCNINKVRENIGMVFQQFNLFPECIGKYYACACGQKEADKGGGKANSGMPSGDSRTGGKGRRISAESFRRTAAACGDCACAGDESRYYAV